jgi:NADH:ubiquinone oxidoreductase subunit E
MTDLRVIVCQGPTCAQRGAAEVVTGIRREILKRGLADHVSVSTSGCRARCEQAVVAALFPGGQPFVRLDPSKLGPLMAACEHRGLASVTPPLARFTPAGPTPPPRRTPRVLWRRWR